MSKPKFKPQSGQIDFSRARWAPVITQFQKLVYEACKKIPRGRVSTYLEIAKRIKKPKSARAVGNALNRNPFAPSVPCHRVVRSDGTVGGFAGGSQKKIGILKKEGVRIRNGKVSGFDKVFFSSEKKTKSRKNLSFQG